MPESRLESGGDTGEKLVKIIGPQTYRLYMEGEWGPNRGRRIDSLVSAGLTCMQQLPESLSRGVLGRLLWKWCISKGESYPFCAHCSWRKCESTPKLVITGGVPIDEEWSQKVARVVLFTLMRIISLGKGRPAILLPGSASAENQAGTPPTNGLAHRISSELSVDPDLACLCAIGVFCVQKSLKTNSHATNSRAGSHFQLLRREFPRPPGMVGGTFVSSTFVPPLI